MVKGALIPLVVDGHVVGAIGVSSGTIDEDIVVAKAGASAVSIFCNSSYLSYRGGNALDHIDNKDHYRKWVHHKSRTEHRWFGYLVSSDAYRDLRASFELVLVRGPSVQRLPLSTILSSIVPMRFPDHNIQKQGAARAPD